MRVVENFKEKTKSKKITSILGVTVLICLLITGIMYIINSGSSKGYGEYILISIISLPITIWSFKATLLDISCVPELLRIKTTVSEDKKIDAYFDYLEEKNFSLLAPFICLIMTILSFFIYTSSIKKIIEWNPEFEICTKILFYILINLCFINFLLSTIKQFKINKAKFLYSLFCLILLITSIIASFFSNITLLILVTSFMIIIAFNEVNDLFKKTKKKENPANSIEEV